jgi:hypothetical protein
MHAAAAAAALASLPPDALRCVLGKLPQGDRAACMLVSKYMNTSVVDPSLWESMTVAEPDATAVRFFRKTRPTSLCVDGASPDDAIWFLDRLVDEACHTTLRTLDISFGVVTRIPEALLLGISRFVALEALVITVEECEEECLLRLPGWFTGLRRLASLAILEGPSGDCDDPWASGERRIVVRLGAARSLLPSQASLTLKVHRTDLLTGVTGLAAMPSLRRVVHVTEVETYENFTVGQGQGLDYLEVSFGEESLSDAFGDGLQRLGDIGKLVVHARNELYLGSSLPAREVSIIVAADGSSDAQIVLDYPFLAESDSLCALGIGHTESSSNGWSVRIINVPSAMQCMELLTRKAFTLAPPGQLEITPYDF